MTRDARERRIEQFERACRQRGFPVTMQRRAVLEAILGREDHPTADQIYDELKNRLPRLSRTTVYRILDTLVQLGIITKICHPGSAARFDPKTHQHHHLVCVHCESIIDLEAGRLDEVTWPDVRGCGFEIRDYHIHFRGTCAECRRKLKKGGGAGRTAVGRRAKKATRRKKTRSREERRTKP